MTDALSPRPRTCCIIRLLELWPKGSNPPPLGLLLWAAWSRLILVPPPSIVPRVLLGCHDTEWSVSGSLLTSLRFHGGTKGSALCGVFLPSTPPWRDLALLCAAALRYSSLMFQVPLWTSTKVCVHPVWSSRAPLLLSSAASRLPASVLCVGVLVFVFCSAPSVLPSFPDPAIPDPRCFYYLLASPCLSVAPFVFWFRVLVFRSSALF